MILTLTCGDYDRTRRLLDGTIGIAGYDLKLMTLPPEDMFRRAFETAEFDISELSFSTFLLHASRGTCAYVGIPVFPSRAFRHSAIYVRSDSDIMEPRDLRGKIIGVRNYLNTAALVVRGLLADDYGVGADEINWRVGDVDQVERETIAIPRLAKPFDIQPAPRGATLADMLMSGEIDALVHYNPPRGFDPAQSRIKRLFADPAAAEQAYFQATGIFPIMHLVGIRRDILQRDPSLGRQVHDAFNKARELAAADLPSPGFAKISTHRTNADVTRTSELTGPDVWRYGIKNNKAALESLTRYAFEQGLTDRRMPIADLFATDLLDT
jgi:4,5-dihydroxyphthalate decarboxylase